jgi:acyl carrier protein
MDIYDTVKQFILQNIMRDNASELTAQTQLAELGILDSLSTLKLLSFLQERFKIEFDASDVESGGFSSLERIERLVIGKVAARG